jgi:DNA-binding LytR/AlgR family response regulator
MKINCLIIDDEPLAINVIKNYLEQIKDFDVVETFSNAIDGLNYLKENSVDLIFLDINMPLLDGLNFIDSLETKPLIIIISAHEEFALKSYELDVLDYLVKPISFPRFMKSINKVNKLLCDQKSSTITISDRPYIFVKIDKKKMKKIYLDEILVIECLKDYLKIITPTCKYIIHETLSNFTEYLPTENFIRIHRSFTIAMDKIDTIEGNSIEISGIRYVIGRTYTNEVKSKILSSSLSSHKGD